MKARECLTLLTLVLLPFVAVPMLSEQHEAPRLMLVQFVALVSLMIQTGEPSGMRASAPSRRFLAAAAGFVGVLGTSVAFSDSPQHALFGSYGTQAGAARWITLVLLAVAIPAPSSTRLWLAAYAASAVVQSCWAGAQLIAGRDPTGSLSHPMFLAGFLLPAVPTTLSLIWSARARSERVAAIVGFAVILAGLASTGRRAPLLLAGLGSGLLLTRGVRRLGAADAFGSKCAAVAATACGAFVLVAVGLGPHIRARWAELASSWPRLPMTLEQRLDFARVAVHGWRAAPLTGRGFGAFENLYDLERRAGMPYERHSHNIVLEFALAAGALGVFALLGFLFVWAIEARRQSVPRAPDFASDSIAAGALCYVAFLCLNFDRIGASAWVVALASTLLPRSESATIEGGRSAGPFLPGVNDQLAPSHEHRSRALSAGIAIGLAIALFATSVKVAVDDSAFARCLSESIRGRFELVRPICERAVASAPFGCDYADAIARELRVGSQRARTAKLRRAWMTPCAGGTDASIEYQLGLAILDSGAELDLATRLLRRAHELSPRDRAIADRIKALESAARLRSLGAGGE